MAESATLSNESMQLACRRAGRADRRHAAIFGFVAIERVATRSIRTADAGSSRRSDA